jgi:hypothetical protein
MTNDELATHVRDDLAKQRDDIANQIGEIRGDIANQIGDIRGDIANQISDIRGDIANQIGEIRGELSGLKQAMTEGFDASRARDEELRDLMKFGREAREVLRDEIHRRFDNADQKHDEQIDLLKTVIRHDATKR